MNCRTICVAVIGWLLVCGSVLAVEVNNDRFTGTRSVSNTVGPVKGDLKTPIRTFKIVRDKSGQTTYGAIFMTVSKDWRYLSCHSVDWLLDGQPMQPIIPAARRGEVMRGSTITVLEVIYMGLSREQFQQLANAGKVEYRICTDEYQLSTEDSQGIRDVLRIFDMPTEGSDVPTEKSDVPEVDTANPPSGMKYKPRIR